MIREDINVLIIGHGAAGHESRAPKADGRPTRPVLFTPGIIATSSLNRALGIIGDRWALQILRESFAGVRRFEEFRSRLGTPRSTLASRLKGLVDSGVLERVPYSCTTLRNEYRLSKQGAELYGTTLLCQAWERSWASQRTGLVHDLLHGACGNAITAELVCSDCRAPVTLDNTKYEIAATGAPRKLPSPLFRRLSSVAAQHHREAGHTCPDLIDTIGDRWTMLVLCAAFVGLRRFDAIQRALCIATNILTHRLNHLVGRGLFTRRRYSHHPPRFEYQLTQKGRDLFPMMVTLMQWGNRWLVPARSRKLRLFHQECGQELHAVVTCDHCAVPVSPDEVVDLAPARSGHPRRAP